MTAVISNSPRRALADEHVLYHVLHPSHADQDQWTPDYRKAEHWFRQFVRDYGAGHLHVETYHAAQYDAQCLLRTGTEVAA